MLESGRKKYFQYVANDLTQLNSDVIRCFEVDFDPTEEVDFERLIDCPVQFYAHCVIKLGLKMGLWRKVDSVEDVGSTDILFRGTQDYGRKIGEPPIRISGNWHIWRTNEEFQHVGRLNEEGKKAFIGLVFNPLGIIELMNERQYPVNYPDSA